MKINKELDLVLERQVDLTPNQIWKAWTTPQYLKEWFCPKPWTVSDCTMELRPGGAFLTTMRSPEGQAFPNEGIFLELIENKKLVWTDALLPGYRPNENAFMTGTILLEPKGNGTLYTAIVQHRNLADVKKHQEMGFEKGWGTALDQLIDFMKKQK